MAQSGREAEVDARVAAEQRHARELELARVVVRPEPRRPRALRHRCHTVRTQLMYFVHAEKVEKVENTRRVPRTQDGGRKKERRREERRIE